MDVGYIFNVSSNNPIIMELKRQKNIQSSPGHSEYKSFYKSVGGNEGEKCNYPTRLDLYGKGCYHDCSYCYAKSLLNFRKLWDAEHPAVADINKVLKVIRKIPSGSIVRLGGMTDCFQPIESRCHVTYEAIKELNKQGVGYLIVTKSSMVADDKYIRLMDKKLAHIQISITTMDDDLSRTYERACVPSQRINALEKLQQHNFDVSLRLSPFIPQYIDFKKLNTIKCDKILVEFLRVNTWIKQWFNIDYSEYTFKQSGYQHLPLELKIKYLEQISGFKQLTVCEDVTEHYEYWKNKINPNPLDCCNLSKK